jgi:hypothetical protein
MLNNILKWTGCVLCSLGALLTSLQKIGIMEPSLINIILLNISAITYLAWSIRIRETNLIIVNAMVLICWSVGLIPKELWQ